jgi:hypothetical protein
LNVFFPAWVWANNPNVDGQHPDNAIRKDCWLGPGVRFAYLSYDAELSTNHSIKCRQMIWASRKWKFCRRSPARRWFAEPRYDPTPRLPGEVQQ